MPSITTPTLAIFVHGGAGNVDPANHHDSQSGCERAAEIGWQTLVADGSALDAVEAAVQDMENNPAFNAGFGSVLTTAGRVEMDAGIMDGRSQAIGAVGLIEHFAHPISIARAVMAETGHYLLAGPNAEDFARAHDFTEIANQELISERRWEQYKTGASNQAGTKDTVGALALDADGNLGRSQQYRWSRFQTAGPHRRFTNPRRWFLRR